MNSWIVGVQADGDDDAFVEIPEEILKLMKLHEHDNIDISLNEENYIVITKAKKYRKMFQQITY